MHTQITHPSPIYRHLCNGIPASDIIPEIRIRPHDAGQTIRHAAAVERASRGTRRGLGEEAVGLAAHVDTVGTLYDLLARSHKREREMR